MKKFLAIFLIAIVACEAVQDIDLEGIWDQLSDAAKNAVNWLKQKGIYDLVKNRLIQAGKIAAIGVCTPYLGPAICTAAVEGVSILLGI